ncbi:hypothetical protein ACIQU6_38410 [Streptomyces sp. NPDC090442]|uniref:hypothetical protein n=1 Tax=Streptomyces sp. NPDC090442 TaxID=3365962 RepID=UPI0037F923F3
MTTATPQTSTEIKVRMAEVRELSRAAEARGDQHAAFALDGELTRLGQLLRNLRPTHTYPDDHCCPGIRSH